MKITNNLMLVLLLVQFSCQGRMDKADSEPEEQKYFITFLSQRSGNGDIYITDFYGEKLQKVTRSDSSEYAPKWVGERADGKSILSFF